MAQQTALQPHGMSGPPHSFAAKAEATVLATIIESRITVGNLHCIRWVWQTNNDGDLRWRIAEPIDGTLHRFIAHHNDSSVVGATYDVAIADAFGGDILCSSVTWLASGLPSIACGLGADLSFNTTEAKIICLRSTPADGLVQAVPVMGLHELLIDAGDDRTHGVFELYYYPYLIDSEGTP